MKRSAKDRVNASGDAPALRTSAQSSIAALQALVDEIRAQPADCIDLAEEEDALLKLINTHRLIVDSIKAKINFATGKT